MKTCRRKIEQITEEDLYVEGEFMAEEDMEEEGYKSHPDCVYTYDYNILYSIYY